MLRYIADRYENVFSNQDLTRYVQEVPRFHNVIGNYVHCNRYIGDLEEMFTFIPGLEFIPLGIFGSSMIPCIGAVLLAPVPVHEEIIPAQQKHRSTAKPSARST